MALIEKILCYEPQGVISFVGAGGKTSIMFHLARLLSQTGKRVLTTTTTKIFVPSPEQSETILVDSDPQTILQLASAGLKYSDHITVAAAYLNNRKLKGFTSEDILRFKNSGLFDWILVEADGAAGRSLKAPAEHEPVVPSCSTALVVVAGLDIVGKSLSEQTVFRARLAGKLLGLAEGEAISESALAHFFSQPEGAFKNAPSTSRRFIFLNKADNSDLCEAGVRIAEKLSQLGTSTAEILIVGQAQEEIQVKSLHSLVQTL
jgi:probable selenium-dependent hydroxylase accessory protein YqeC